MSDEKGTPLWRFAVGLLAPVALLVLGYRLMTAPSVDDLKTAESVASLQLRACRENAFRDCQVQQIRADKAKAALAAEVE
jgi:hypothetical protein